MIGYLLVGILGAWGFGVGLLEGNLALIILGGFLAMVMAGCIYVEQTTEDSTERSTENNTA